MNGQETNLQWEAGLRRELTAAEAARLQELQVSHPDEAAAWQQELRLNQLLRELPDPPVASNFTALVLQAVDRAAPSPRPWSTDRGWEWIRIRRWPARLALASSAFALGLFLYSQHRIHIRAELVRSAAQISDLAGQVSPEILRDFDAIQRLSQVSVKVDDDLLAALRAEE